MIVKVGIASLLVFSLVACASSPKSEIEVGPRLSAGDYNSLINKNTASEKQYDGFYAKLEAHATLLNTDVQTAVLQKTTDALQWPAQTAQREREKLFQENSNSTKVFLSLFLPHRRLNDLAKGNSIWKIYLESQGERYEGKAVKKSMPYEVLISMFPHHSRWAIPYDVVFPVPLSAIEKSESVLVITSSVGTARFKFPAAAGSGLF